MSLKENIKSLIRGERPTRQYIKRGMIVGKNFSRQPGCLFDYSHCWLISIGDNVTLAPRVQILAHDASTKMHLDYVKIGHVTIGNKVFVGANTTILPNVKIGDNVIIGANSVVTKDIPDNYVAVGNPARIIMTTEEYINKNAEKMKSCPKFDYSYTVHHNITNEKKQEMIDKLQTTIGYIK